MTSLMTVQMKLKLYWKSRWQASYRIYLHTNHEALTLNKSKVLSNTKKRTSGWACPASYWQYLRLVTHRIWNSRLQICTWMNCLHIYHHWTKIVKYGYIKYGAGNRLEGMPHNIRKKYLNKSFLIRLSEKIKGLHLHSSTIHESYGNPLSEMSNKHRWKHTGHTMHNTTNSVWILNIYQIQFSCIWKIGAIEL